MNDSNLSVFSDFLLDYLFHFVSLFHWLGFLTLSTHFGVFLEVLLNTSFTSFVEL